MDDEKKKLAKELEDALHNLCLKIESELNYRPTILINMLNRHGGLKTTKRLIDRAEPSSAYKKLVRLNKLDLTVEMLLLDNVEWHSLFERSVIMTAIRRIKQTKSECTSPTEILSDFLN